MLKTFRRILNYMKYNSKRLSISIFYSILILSSSCVEEFIPENLTFESLLVVEASVTDELKNHEIRISRTFKFNDEPLF